MLTFTADRKQKNEMEGLAHWVAENAWVRERIGETDADLKQSRDSIRFEFEQLDKLKVPFWVQNAVVAFAEDWRRHESQSMRAYLKTKQIYI